MSAPRRLCGPVRWYVGKGLMTQRIIPLIPWSAVYCEPFGGAASIMCALPPRPCEVYNDLDTRLVGLFRVLQAEDTCEALARRLAFTLYSRDEFIRALDILKSDETDPVTRAWAFFTAQNQGFAGKATFAGDWGRAFITGQGMAATCSRWLGGIANIDRWHERFSRVQIDNRDALDVIKYWDSPDTCFYLDPPYATGTRVKGKDYQHECTDAQHTALVDLLLTLQGAAVLSGYDTPLYQPLRDAGWESTEFNTACHAAGRVRGSKLRGAGAALEHVGRVEVVWRNPRAREMMERQERQEGLL